MKKSQQKVLSPIRIIRQAALVLSMAITLPVVVHLLPLSGEVPAGARLLPIFLAPLIALYFFRPSVVIPAAVAAPILNFLLTGQPQPELLFTLTLEITVFGLIFSRLRELPRWSYAAAFVAIVAARLFSGIVFQADIVAGFYIAAPGIVLLVLTNLLMNRLTR